MHHVSQSCEGERCACGLPATHKVSEVIQWDDPAPARHPLTAYVCCRHFRALVGPAAPCGLAAPRPSRSAMNVTNDTFQHAKDNANPDCPKCHGTGQYMYDHNHSTICDVCCKHDMGWWQLLEHYGANNGKWCCRAGCGRTMVVPPVIGQPT